MSVSKSEQHFLDELRNQGQLVFTTAEVRLYWGSSENTDNALSRLLRKQQIIRLAHGIYALPALAALPEDSLVKRCAMIPHLAPDAVVGYHSAIQLLEPGQSYWPDFTCYIQTTHRKLDLNILGNWFRFIQMQPKYLFDIQPISVAPGLVLAVTGIEKTILDCAHRPEFSGGLGTLVGFIARNRSRIQWKHLADTALSMQNSAIEKRLGYLIELFDIDFPERDDVVGHWQSHISRGIIMLDPKQVQRGHIHTRWEIEDNVFEPKGHPQ
ncbi:MAG: type IV toxin-antitoxin system AbiEi family antitoxin domain-containing protein [Anaerolineae bacterium]|nr:type IV toxin-antitoxin system AbiEi family antitoxin domain-containing protein [Anaerolineae bacterium]